MPLKCTQMRWNDNFSQSTKEADQVEAQLTRLRDTTHVRRKTSHNHLVSSIPFCLHSKHQCPNGEMQFYQMGNNLTQHNQQNLCLILVFVNHPLGVAITGVFVNNKPSYLCRRQCLYYLVKQRWHCCWSGYRRSSNAATASVVRDFSNQHQPDTARLSRLNLSGESVLATMGYYC